MDTVMKITCVESETVHTSKMIMFGSSMLCGTDLNGKLFQKKMSDVVAIDMVPKEESAKGITVVNYHTLPEKK